jgi:UDP-N-acetylglucosamine 4,6-dehydratase
MFDDKVLLITGGTGSFGNAVIRRFLDSPLREIRIFSRDEKKQDDMRTAYANARLKFYIGDVRSYDSVLAALHGVDYVFHAAALKQVPSCEFFPGEAVRTNILGTVNAMGMSKALMEKVMTAKSAPADQRGTVLCGTRYGNVIASRGSVIPLFVEQIRQGKPVTVTDPKMTRFIMSLENAVDLVLYAFKEGKPGDIFVQKAPACEIGDLAQALLEMFGSSAGMRVIGTRHGEKLYETLLNREEMARAEDLGAYYRVPADTRDLNYGKYFVEGEQRISAREDYNSSNTRRLTVPEIKDLLHGIEYVKNALKP